jgi:predicted RNA-binding protein YlxR (DUF448 family)
MTQTNDTDAERRCVASGVSYGKDGLVRFALAPDGKVVPDLAERLPGRGVWVAAHGDAVRYAVSKGLFSRGFKTRALADADLNQLIERLLVTRVGDLLALARRAGAAVTGFEKCRAALSRGNTVLLHARDGSMDGLQKLAGADREQAIRVLDGAELGLPFGRESAVHVAVTPGGLADGIKRECSRLAGFRGLAGVWKEGR